jgi:hypothetical protein
MAPMTRGATKALMSGPFTLHPRALRKLGVAVPEPDPVPAEPVSEYEPTTPSAEPVSEYEPTTPATEDDYSPTTPRRSD